MRKTQVNGYAALLFFFETIGIDAGECPDQGGLAVVDMAGGSDDDVFHFDRFYPSATGCPG